MTTFTGFPATAPALLAELPGLARDDYVARKPEITATLVEPAKAYVEATVPALREVFGPGIDGAPKIGGSISPLNNDLRFAAEGTPLYRDHLLVWFWDGPAKKGSPLLGMRLAPSGVGTGVGMPFTPDQLARWRAAIADDGTGARFAADLDALLAATRRHDPDVAGRELKKVPKPHDPEHPRGDLLRHKGFQVRWEEPAPKTLSSAGFVDWTVRRFERAAAVHTFLRDHVR